MKKVKHPFNLHLSILKFSQTSTWVHYQFWNQQSIGQLLAYATNICPNEINMFGRASGTHSYVYHHSGWMWTLKQRKMTRIGMRHWCFSLCCSSRKLHKHTRVFMQNAISSIRDSGNVHTVQNGYHKLTKMGWHPCTMLVCCFNRMFYKRHRTVIDTLISDALKLLLLGKAKIDEKVNNEPKGGEVKINWENTYGTKMNLKGLIKNDKIIRKLIKKSLWDVATCTSS